MIFPKLKFSVTLANLRQFWQSFFTTRLLTLCLTVCTVWLLSAPPAWAGINDDRFDGNIFALYGGNGSLVPPVVKLTDSLSQKRPALLVFFLDDSRECKQFASTVSELQRFYGRAADFMPINVDTLLPDKKYTPEDPGYYYKGYVPQTVIIDQAGKVALDVNGLVPFETVDDEFRNVFNLLPRSESVELRRRSFNEFNSEIVETQKK